MREETRRIERKAKRAEETVWLAGLSFFVVIPAICEEPLFRGILLRGLAKGSSSGRGLLYSALFFAGALAYFELDRRGRTIFGEGPTS